MSYKAKSSRRAAIAAKRSITASISSCMVHHCDGLAEEQVPPIVPHSLHFVSCQYTLKFRKEAFRFCSCHWNGGEKLKPYSDRFGYVAQ